MLIFYLNLVTRCHRINIIKIENIIICNISCKNLTKMADTGIVKRNKKSKQKAPIYRQNPLKLSTMCVLKLDESEVAYLSQYSTDFTTTLRRSFWKDIHNHPDLIPETISDFWIND